MSYSCFVASAMRYLDNIKVDYQAVVYIMCFRSLIARLIVELPPVPILLTTDNNVSHL